ncbi:MAG: precorrin-2 dehydrogenase/sirohydrochlorin ferrochelatase family protein [Peptostreptococcaceae bacterium]
MLYPINLELDKFDIVIVGGGDVAYRKCTNFINFNKKIRVVAPKFLDEFLELKKHGIELIEDIYKEEYIKDYFIVVAATNKKEVNNQIGEYCKIHNKLVNVVDDVELSNYTVPSYVKRGDLLLSISTGGKSPSLSRKIKMELEKQYDESYEEYINLLGIVRSNIINKFNDVSIRRKLIRDLVNMDLEELRIESKKYI